MEWPAQKITNKPLKDLTPYARNARTHTDAQVDQIAASIKEWGFTTALLIDETGGIIAGHGRLLAAQKMGLKTVPTVTAKGWTDAQKRAYVIADNKLALNAGWDDELLKVEFQELEGLGFDISLVGFDVGELDDLFDSPPEGAEGAGAGSLADKFGVPPFSVLNAREGWWQDRKRAWLALGIRSEVGRGENGYDAAPGGSKMVAGYDAEGKRLVGLKNIGGREMSVAFTSQSKLSAYRKRGKNGKA